MVENLNWNRGQNNILSKLLESHICFSDEAHPYCFAVFCFGIFCFSICMRNFDSKCKQRIIQSFTSFWRKSNL